MKSSELSESLQDYLKEIYKLEEANGRATTSAVADRMGVAASSATAVLKRLTALGLVRHQRYRGAVLTPAGRKVAIEVMGSTPLQLALSMMKNLATLPAIARSAVKALRQPLRPRDDDDD